MQEFVSAERYCKWDPIGFLFWRSKDGGWGLSIIGFACGRLSGKRPTHWSFLNLIAGEGRKISTFSMKFVTAQRQLSEKIYAEVQSVPDGEKERRRKGASVGQQS